MRRGIAALALLLLSPALAHAEAAADRACPPGQSPLLLVRLYFGQSIPGSGVVSRRAWQRFLAERVTPALPDGFTVIDATGQYRAAGGAVGREGTEVVEAAAADTPEFRRRVGELAEQYKRQFSQGAVGIVSAPVCGLF